MKNEHIVKMMMKFKELMNRQDNPRIFYSPGRVNLIGEHIDYNGGLVFPAAINIGTYGFVGKRNDQKVRLFSNNYPMNGLMLIDLRHLEFNKDHGWANYVKGILDEIIQRGYVINHGFDLLIEGNLPTASGLSSSASLELLVAYIANELFDLKMTRTELATLSQTVENGYMGMHCGIMDQLIIAQGVQGKALLMNTATLEVEAVDASFAGYQFVIMNTNYQRKTTDSKYNERVAECGEALKLIHQEKSINYLCELNPKDLDIVRTSIKDDVIYKRAKHVITEQARTIAAKQAMMDRDPIRFAELLNQSHQSLKEDYAVTGLHLDTLVEEAITHGAIGARVTGAGFGGCAIALVQDDMVTSMKEQVKRNYKDKTGLEADFYQVSFDAGVREVTSWS